MTQAKNFTLETKLYKLDRVNEKEHTKELEIISITKLTGYGLTVYVNDGNEKFSVMFSLNISDSYINGKDEHKDSNKERYLITSKRRYFVQRELELQKERVLELESTLLQAKGYLESLKKENVELTK